MGPPKQNNILGILDFQRKQQKDSLDTFAASIHIVAEEEIVSVFNIAVGRFLGRRSEGLEEAVDVVELAVEVPEDFDWRTQLHRANRTFTIVP